MCWSCFHLDTITQRQIAIGSCCLYLPQVIAIIIVLPFSSDLCSIDFDVSLTTWLAVKLIFTLVLNLYLGIFTLPTEWLRKWYGILKLAWFTPLFQFIWMVVGFCASLTSANNCGYTTSSLAVFAISCIDFFIALIQFVVLMGMIYVLYCPIRQLPALPTAATEMVVTIPEVSVWIYTEVDQQKTDPQTVYHTCTICTCEFKPTQLVAQLRCKHHFHQDCIVSWLHRAKTCPNCRMSVEP